jgi:hypothetical protein
VSGTEIGPETFDAVRGALEALASDWQTPLDGGRRELWLMACLRATLDYEVTALIGGIPPGERDWPRLLDALGYDRGDPAAMEHGRAGVEAGIEDFERFHAPLPHHDSWDGDVAPF